MAHEEPKESKGGILGKVGDNRRDFVKRVLVGAPFAAPVIASFAIGSLGVEAALAREPFPIGGAASAQNTTTSAHCGGVFPDPGYVGPNQFRAFVIDSCSRVNGEVSITAHGNHTAGIDIDMVRDATVTSAQLTINGVTVANIPLHGNPDIGHSDIVGLPDFDALLQAMAAQQVSVSVQGTLVGRPFSAQGPVVAGNGGVISLNP